MAYCEYFRKSERDACTQVCRDFVDAEHTYLPEYKKKVKIHLILHLVDTMVAFGPLKGIFCSFWVLNYFVLCLGLFFFNYMYKV